VALFLLYFLFLFFNAWHTDGGRQGKARAMAKNVLFQPSSLRGAAWRLLIHRSLSLITFVLVRGVVGGEE
jgi:hypothetical protein